MQQYKNLTIGIIVVVAILGVVAYYQSNAFGEQRARGVVTAFGEQLKNVPLSGEAEIARQAIEEHYTAYVLPQLLEQWKEKPSIAPGRLTSSPWPERIEITDASPQGEGFVVSGNVVSMTSVEETEGGVASLQPVVILVVETEEGWRIAAYQEQQTEDDR